MTPRYCGALALLALLTLGATPKLPKAEPEPIPILPAEEVWTERFEALPAANVWMDDERVYVPLKGEGLQALSRETGEPVWVEPVDLTHPPLAVDGRLLIALPEELRALDPGTGRVQWSRPLPRKLAVEITAAEAIAFVVDDTGELVAMRGRDGEELWRRSFGSASLHVPAFVAPNAIAVTTGDGRVITLDVRTGKPLWERALPGTLSAPAAARDRVFVGSTNNFFYALDAGSGSERWRWRTGGDVTGAAAAGDRVYFVSLDNVLRAVNRDNGNQLWKVAIPSRPSAPPIAFDDVVVLTGIAPRFDAYNGKTGAALGTFTALADLQGAPVIDTTPLPYKVAIVALTRDGRLSALRPTGLMFPDPPLVPFPRLPGRELPREPRPGAARLP